MDLNLPILLYYVSLLDLLLVATPTALRLINEGEEARLSERITNLEIEHTPSMAR